MKKMHGMEHTNVLQNLFVWNDGVHNVDSAQVYPLAFS